MHSTSCTGLSLMVAAVLATGAAAAEKKQFRYQVEPGASVAVVNDYGPVRIHAGQPGAVVVTASPSSAKVQVDCRQTGNRVEVRSHFLQDASSSDGRVEYDVQVPPDANLVVRTSTGPVEVKGVRGDVAVDADTGQVEVGDSSGHVHVRTVTGPIVLSNLKDGFVDGRSVGGQVTLKNVSGRNIAVNTTGGPIVYSGDFGGGGQYSLSSHSGTIDVTLPASASVDVTASSVTGRVENDLPLHAPEHPTMSLVEGKSLAGISNSGASSVHLQTFSGRIRVKKQ